MSSNSQIATYFRRRRVAPRRHRPAPAIAIAILTTTFVSTADPAGHDPVAARALFNAGKALLESGDWNEACEKFEKSLTLDRNVSTLIKIARCREREGKLATAGDDYERALSLNRENVDQSAKRRAELAATIEREFALLRPRIPRLRIVVVDPPSGLTIRRNGNLVPRAVLGESLPVDPGVHEISLEAPGYAAQRTTVTVSEGKAPNEDIEVSFRGRLEPSSPTIGGASVVAITPVPAISTPASLAAAAAARQQAVDSRAPGTGAHSFRGGGADAGSGQRTAGFIVGSAGLVGLGGAGYFGLRTLDLVGKSNPYCDHPGGACEEEGMSYREQASRAQTAGIVLAGIGGAALITGITLLLTADSSSRMRAAALSLGPTAVSGSVKW